MPETEKKEKRKKLFSDDDFDKRLSVGDELVFDKPELTKLRVDLTWSRSPRTKELTDLDVCAFLLDKDGLMSEREDLVYFGSKLRWKPKKSFDDPEFNPLEGEFSQWPAPGFRNPLRWMEATLPVSGDGGVIGSWDDKGDDGDEGDDEAGEQMHIQLDEIDVLKHQSIVLAAVVAKKRVEAGETFADADSPVATIYNAENGEEIASYALDSDFPGKDAVCFARLEYDENTFLWNFVPLADGYNGGMQFLAREVFN